MDVQRKAIALAGLLHDIGKFMQRAEVELCEESKEMEKTLCPWEPGKRYHSYRHVLWTDHFFRRIADEDLLWQIFGPPTYPDNVPNLASYHHKPASKLQGLIQQADNLSAKEREEGDTVAGGNWYKKRRLSSVFKKVSLEASPPAEHRFKYNLSPLSLDRESFPKELKEEESLVSEYKALWEGFSKEFKEIEYQVRQSKNRFDFLFNSLYYLLQKYTWCIPSYTQTECDISLFDHLRTTSALTLCLYDVQNSKKHGEEEILLVKGDISGIQKFIYRFTQPTGIEGLAKMFRGRSFYLSLLPLILARYITSELDLTIAHILWCGGGGFQLLLPNTEETKSRLEEIEGKIADWFLKDFEAELALCLGKVDFYSSGFEKFASYLEEASARAEEEKKRKFIGKLQRAKDFSQEKGKMCRVCELYPREKDELCEKCRSQRDIGSKLPKKANFLVLAKERVKEDKESFSISFGDFGTVYLIGNEEDAQKFKKSDKVTEILGLNNLNFPLGFTFLGKETAYAKKQIEIGEIEGLEEKIEEEHILPFEVLSEMAEGDKRIGVLKMDIDHLGLIFALGLEEEDRTISRIATLSRMLDWFFSGYINTLAKEVIFQNWKGKEDVKMKEKVEGCLYTVYSGGDDLLVIAPWSEVVEFARRVHEDFKKFTCQNRDIDLSAGVFLCKPKFPISRASRLATEALDEAKEEGKKRISLFKERVTWEDKDNLPGFGQLLELSEILTEAIKNENKLPRRFLHRLIRLRESYFKDEDDKLDLNYIPALVYLIARNISDEKLKEKLWEYFISGSEAQGFFQKSLTPASITLLKTRGG